MKNKKNIIIGLSVVIIGVLYLINNLNIISFDLFFDGWWTLFIIIPSIIELITSKNNRNTSVLFLILGILLLTASLKIIDWHMIYKLFVPILIIDIGLIILLQTNIKKKVINKNNNDKLYLGILSGNEEKITSLFEGAIAKAILGGVEIDLTTAIIKEDVAIECFTIMGGITIKLPTNVNVETNGLAILGGVENLTKSDTSPNLPTIVINYQCILGGIEIK